MKTLWIIGSGGHAKVAIEAARQTGAFDIAGCFDDATVRHGSDVAGVPILGDTSAASLAHHGVERAIIAIGDNAVRQRIARQLTGLVTWETVVHPQAWVAESVRLAAGMVVMAGAIVQPDARIGEHAILNTSCSIDHDARIGAYAHVGPGSHLAGDVWLQEGVSLGVGVSVIPGITIGSWTVVGAGATVTTNLQPNVTAVGVPARVIKSHPGS